MSIFDRLITTLTGGDTPAPAAPAKPAAAQDSQQPRRFMGRDGAASPAEAAAQERGFEAGAQVWLYIQPQSQRLLLVNELGSAEGQELNNKMGADLERAGLCEEVVYHASYDQYWKMPSQSAIVRMPALYHIPTAGPARVQSSTKLVKQGEARGYWLRVRIRAPHELPQASEPTV